MKRKKYRIIWDTFYAAAATGVLSHFLDMDPILIGLIIGSVGAAVCYFNLKGYNAEVDK